MPAEALNRWKAEHLRITLMGPAPWGQDAQTLFKDIFGLDPETVSGKPSNGEFSAVGPWKEHLAHAKVMLNRLDILVSPPPVMTLAPEILGGNARRMSSLLVEAVKNWINKKSIAPLRIAIGATGFMPVADLLEGNRRTSALAGVFSSELGGYSDIQLQINKPTNFSRDDLGVLNRVATIATVSVEIGTFVGGLPQQAASSLYSALTTDVNSDATRREPLRVDDALLVIDELSVHQLRMYERGVDGAVF